MKGSVIPPPKCFGKWKDCEIAEYVNCSHQFLCYKADEEAADLLSYREG